MKKKKASPKKTKTSKAAKPKMDIAAIIEERFKHHVGVIVEDSNSKFQQIQESFSTLATNEAVQRVENEVKDVKSKQEIIEQVVKGHSAMLNAHTAILKDLSDKQEEHSARLDRIETKLDRKADKKDLENLADEIKSVLSGHEQRLVNLESKLSR